MSQMMWQAGFVGRDADLRVMQAAWHDARRGTPRVLALVAESGFGKTRLAQEFYNWLSITHDGRDGVGYWPDRLLRSEDNLRVNPDIVNPDNSDTPMPFLWWGLRLADPGGRNATAQSAFAGGLEALTPHLAAMQAATERVAVKRRRLLGGGATATDVAVGVTETLIDTLSSVATFGLLGLGKTLVEAALEDRKAARELRMLDAQDISPVAAGARARDTLAETAVADLGRLCMTPPQGIAAVPLVILVDDIQWIGADAGTASFLTVLLERARAESWPLLLLLTSWRSEWRASVAEGTHPASLADPTQGDIVHELGPVVGLEAIIERALPGLPPDQVIALSRKAEGTPRLLDEMLMYLQRRRKAFVNRDPAAALTEDGLADVLARDFAEFVADRLHAAPEHVRRALALASTQGVSFSPRLVRRLAEGLRIADVETGLAEGDDPHSFVTGALRVEGNGAAAEFRLRAYRAAAREDLGNLLDEAEVEDHLRAALLAVGTDPGAASDQELALVLDAVDILNENIDAWRPMIFAAGAELVWRARAAHDSRKAGTLAEALLPHIDHLPTYDHWEQIVVVLDGAINWIGRDRRFEATLHALIQKMFHHPDRSSGPNGQFALMVMLSRLSDLVEYLDGAFAAVEMRDKQVQIMRALVAETPSVKNRRELAISLICISDVKYELDQLADARFLLDEAVLLTGALAEEQQHEDAWRDHAITLGRMAVQTWQIDGEAAALVWSNDEEDIWRSLVAHYHNPHNLLFLSYALGRKALLVGKLDGPAAARPLREEALEILRPLAEAQPTPDLQVALAQSLREMAQVVDDLDGPAAALPLFKESEGLFRAVSRTDGSLFLKEDLARTLAALGDVVQALEGDAAALSIWEEAVSLRRAIALAQPTPTILHELANALQRLAEVREHVDAPAAVLPLRAEAEQLLRDVARDRPRLDATLQIVRALENHAMTLGRLGRFASAKVRWTEALASMDRVASEAPEFEIAPWTVGCRFDLLRLELLGPDPWARPFAHEVIPPVPHPVMDQLDGLLETCRAWADRSSDPDAVLWGDCIMMERARAMLANGNAAGAAATLDRLEPSIAAAFAADPRGTVRLAMDHGVLSALCAMARDVPQEALAALDRAAQARASLPDEARSALRYGAVIAWLRADALDALGRGKDAQACLAQGLVAAQRFAARACSDGPAILAAYQGRTVMPL